MIFERWTVPAREILQFLSGGLSPRVGFCDSRAMDLPTAWNSAIPERWSSPAREILRFPSDGLLPRVEFCNSRAVEDSRTRDSALSG